MNQLFGFYDIAGHRADGTSNGPGLLSDALGISVEIEPTDTRSGAFVVDAGTRRPSTASSATSEDGRFTVSLLASAGPRADSVRRAVQLVERETAEAALGNAPDRLGGICETVRSMIGDGFLCAIRDRRDDTLTLLRDRDCLEQLYFFEEGGLLWFGSHLPRLRRLPSFPEIIDGSAVAFFLAFGFPPSERTFHGSVRRLPACAALAVGADAFRIDRLTPGRPAPAADPSIDPMSVLCAAVVADVAGAVAGKAVGVLGSPDDPRTAWLVDAALAAGAARAVPIARGSALPVAECLHQVARLVEAEGEVFATPLLSILIAGADLARGTVDLCLSAEGSTLLAAGASRHARFAKRIADRWGGRAPWAARPQAFHDDRLFVRDHYFEELAIFSDAARLAIAGPTLSQWNVFAMADELGSDLEAATGENAADLAAAFDASFLAANAIQPMIGAISRLCGIPIRAPFASATVLAWANALSCDERRRLKDALAHWPADDVGDTSGADARVAQPDGAAADSWRMPGLLAQGFVGRTAVQGLRDDPAHGGGRGAARLWTLGCLEAWLSRDAERPR